MPAKFVVKKGTTGKWRFNLLSTNGKMIATSEAYETKRAMLAGIEAVRKNAGTATVVDPTTDGTKTTAAKSTARKTTARKTSARATTGRTSAARKTTARKSTARKSTARKTTARKTTARKSTARKTTSPSRGR